MSGADGPTGILPHLYMPNGHKECSDCGHPRTTSWHLPHPPHAYTTIGDGLCVVCGFAEAEVGWHSGNGWRDPADLQFTTVTLSEIAPERVEWLWPGRLPRGKTVMCDGDPGVSKSTLGLTLAAHISTGRDWPDGQPCPLGDIILLTAEDGLADTVRPRLDAAGGDPTRVHVLQTVRLGIDKDGQPVRKPPTLADVSQLESAIRHHNASLVIVDVLMAYLPSGTDSHKDQDVRAVLSRIKDISDATGCAFLYIRHLNKGNGRAMYRGGGSIAINGAARISWLVGRDPKDHDLIVVAQTKNNLAAMPESMSYRLADADGVARIAWAENSQRTADDLVTDTAEQDIDERDEIAACLREYLQDCGGQAPASDCQKMLTVAFGKMSGRDFMRVRQRAKIVTKRSGAGKGSCFIWHIDSI